MTYGQLKLRLTQAFPSVSLDLLEGWANDRYQEILSELPWSRLTVQAVLQTVAPYSTGTASVTLGSASITGVGTTWAAGMSRRQFRITSRNEQYTFTFVSATTGTLDRPYEGPTATLAAYSISQNIYSLPANAAMLQEDAFGSWDYGPLRRLTSPQLGAYYNATGAPLAWASYMDDTGTPPNMEVKLFPSPNLAIGIPYEYIAGGPDLATTTTLLQIWMDPGALVEGIHAKVKAHLRDYAGAQFHMVEAARCLKGMRSTEAQGMARCELTMDRYYTRHRRNRGGCW